MANEATHGRFDYDEGGPMNGLRTVNDAVHGRYLLMLDDEQVGFIDYDAVGDASILIKHTEVAPEHEGKGFAAQLVRSTLDDIRKQDKTVIPICPYTLNFVRRHAEYHDLVRTDMRSKL
jgi:uncharacterized protein